MSDAGNVENDGKSIKGIAVDPEVLSIIKNPDRPEAFPSIAKAPNNIPGVSGFIAGMKSLFAYKREGLQFFANQASIYGKVFRSQLGPYSIVGVTDHEVISQILKNGDRCWSTALAVERVTRGLSFDIDLKKKSRLMSLDFDAHRRMRNLVQPAFSDRALASYLTVIHHEFVHNIEAWPRDGAVSFRVEARKIFSQLAARLFFGIGDPKEAARLEGATRDYWGAIPVVLKNRHLSERWKRGVDGVATLSSIMYDLIPKRRDEGGVDLFSQLCKSRDDTGGLDDDQLVDLMLNIIFAAFDTTTMGITSMAYLLAKYPHWQEVLRAEAMRLPEQATLADFNGMERTTQVWKETLRMFPVSAITPRVSLGECQVGSYVAPPRTLVFNFTGLLGQDPDLWDHPQRFDPERFSSARAEHQRHRGQYLPFGHGVHTCVGAALANLEARVFWSIVLTRYRFSLAKDYDAVHCMSPLGSVSGEVALKVERL
ncbi:cytochrome P450 (plasmid) [Burkholderia sp. FERM BP-3421]|uniref:Cytochrome P450 n=1 Tax=Pseudomonas sp. 2663 TaxID=764483 RepID=E9KSN5_9PSED|nr:cytochrome P450 [Burkholderia sp. FERM BP-3421]ADH01499.1 cytochrome P450 [Pseudomonas sp. 2663]AIC32704.1 FR9R [Burkholderia sp. FERM BP-3421]WDD90492.1 cytochrome P450 [Burkholderia sp. FERM BP-3421]